MRMPHSISEEAHICRNEVWLCAWIGQMMMMMNGSTGCYLSLSETGGQIWDLLEEPTTVAALCHALQCAYRVEQAEVRPAVYAFLEQMIQQDAVLVQHAAVC